MKYLEEKAPESRAVTDYDLCHALTYARLLDADATGTPWSVAAREILGSRQSDDPDAIRACWTLHLERARWLADIGFPGLVASVTEQQPNGFRDD